MRAALLLLLIAAYGPASANSNPGRFATVGTHRLYFEILGSGPPLVLLHGGASTIQDSFHFQVDFLAAHHTVIAIEQRGQGHSPDAPEPLSYAGMVEDTAGLLKQLNIANADVVGFSDGAILSLMLGIRHPELVRRIVASGANLEPQGLTSHSYQETLNSGAGSNPTGSTAGPGNFDEKLRQLWLHHPTADELNAAMLQGLHRPVLIMSGDNDEVRLEHTLLIYRSLPDARLWILPGTAHATFGSRPQWVNPVLKSFLDGN